jgi:hypothetical protein
LCAVEPVHATWLIAVLDCSYLGLSDEFSLIPGTLPSADWTLRFEPRDTNDDIADSAKLQYSSANKNSKNNKNEKSERGQRGSIARAFGAAIHAP